MHNLHQPRVFAKRGKRTARASLRLPWKARRKSACINVFLNRHDSNQKKKKSDAALRITHRENNEHHALATGPPYKRELLPLGRTGGGNGQDWCWRRKFRNGARTARRCDGSQNRAQRSKELTCCGRRAQAALWAENQKLSLHYYVINFIWNQQLWNQQPEPVVTKKRMFAPT
jgi:hypothetical protein